MSTSIKPGDLIKATSNCCEKKYGVFDCPCFFCVSESSGVGVVIERLNREGVKHSSGYWSVIFDVGLWRVYGFEAEVISESRGPS